MKDLSLFKIFLGIEVARSKEDLSLSPKKYRFDFVGGNTHVRILTLPWIPILILMRIWRASCCS